jgi:hypothetical protein
VRKRGKIRDNRKEMRKLHATGEKIYLKMRHGE